MVVKGRIVFWLDQQLEEKKNELLRTKSASSGYWQEDRQWARETERKQDLEKGTKTRASKKSGGSVVPLPPHRALLKECSWLHAVYVWLLIWLSKVTMMKFTEGLLCAYSLSRVWLCDLRDCSPPGSSVQGILQARILEWVAMPSSRRRPQPRDWTQVSRIADRFFTVWTTREAL